MSVWLKLMDVFFFLVVEDVVKVNWLRMHEYKATVNMLWEVFYHGEKKVSHWPWCLSLSLSILQRPRLMVKLRSSCLILQVGWPKITCCLDQNFVTYSIVRSVGVIVMTLPEGSTVMSGIPDPPPPYSWWVRTPATSRDNNRYTKIISVLVQVHSRPQVVY